MVCQQDIPPIGPLMVALGQSAASKWWINVDFGLWGEQEPLGGGLFARNAIPGTAVNVKSHVAGARAHLVFQNFTETRGKSVNMCHSRTA